MAITISENQNQNITISKIENSGENSTITTSKIEFLIKMIFFKQKKANSNIEYFKKYSMINDAQQQNLLKKIAFLPFFKISMMK
jgi:hypothetical protein